MLEIIQIECKFKVTTKLWMFSLPQSLVKEMGINNITSLNLANKNYFQFYFILFYFFCQLEFLTTRETTFSTKLQVTSLKEESDDLDQALKALRSLLKP